MVWELTTPLRSMELIKDTLQAWSVTGTQFLHRGSLQIAAGLVWDQTQTLPLLFCYLLVGRIHLSSSAIQPLYQDMENCKVYKTIQSQLCLHDSYIWLYIISEGLATLCDVTTLSSSYPRYAFFRRFLFFFFGYPFPTTYDLLLRLWTHCVYLPFNPSALLVLSHDSTVADINKLRTNY
jgi:hypothetical protein